MTKLLELVRPSPSFKMGLTVSESSVDDQRLMFNGLSNLGLLGFSELGVGTVGFLIPSCI